MREAIGAGLVGAVAGGFVGSSLLVSWGCSVLGCSNPAVERVEVVGAAASTDSGVGSAGRRCVVVVGIGDVVADGFAGEQLDRSQTLGWGGSVGKGSSMSRSVVLTGAVGRMMTLRQILRVKLRSA